MSAQRAVFWKRDRTLVGVRVVGARVLVAGTVAVAFVPRSVRRCTVVDPCAYGIEHSGTRRVPREGMASP
jgi:hypothetical protein